MAATVAPGHRVASGANGDPRFPGGTIALQLPLFRRLAPELLAWLGAEPHPGTLNLSVGHPVAPGAPERRLPAVRWTDALPPETFLLSRAWLEAGGAAHRMLLYIPDPATKPDHHQPADMVELLGPRVDGVGYGAAVTLRVPPGVLVIGRSGRARRPAPPPAG